MTQVNQQTGFVETGDVFVVVEEHVGGTFFKAGDIVELAHDDYTSCPQYRNVLTGDTHYYYTCLLQKLEQVAAKSAIDLPKGTEAVFLGYVPGNSGSYHGHWGFLIGEKFTADDSGHLVSASDGRALSWNWGFKLAILPTKAAIFVPVEQGSATPAEQLGYKVGDHFIITAGTTFQTGSVVELIEDDGSDNPRFRLVSGSGIFGREAYHTMPNRMTKIDNSENTQEAPVSVEQKRDRIIVIGGLIADLQAEEAELRAQLRAAGFQLIEPEVASAIPDGVSVTDYRTWQKGDIVRCTTKQGKGTATLTVGGEYTIVCIDSDGDRYITDDDGDDVYYCVKSCFEFVRRP
tara:strand:+ start:4472 stop:5512 length:1041 start_codon:yes stop_codon:yes gene_type:complete